MSALTDLRRDLDNAGYYPDLVADVITTALANEVVVQQLVHLETTFDQTEVRRHITALALTPTRLIVAHVDDHPPEVTGGAPAAVAASEIVPLSEIKGVVLTHGVRHPENYCSGQTPDEVTLGVTWNAVHRVDVGPAQCPDPSCEADHGLTGTVVPDDLLLRIATDAEGTELVQRAIAFGKELSLATRTLSKPYTTAIPQR